MHWLTRVLPGTPPGRAAASFTLTSGGGVLLGGLVAAAHGVPLSLGVRNAGAWLVGALLAALLARHASGRGAWLLLPLAVFGVGATFLDSGLSGVHRWVGLGPVRLHAAALLLPGALVAWTDLAARRHPLGLAVLGLAGLLALQPDAAQAVALAGAVGAALLVLRRRGALGGGVAIGSGVAALVSLGRADPLAPVPEVEGIVGLAWETSPGLAVLAVLLLAGAALSPLAARASPVEGVRAAAWGLAVYFALCVLAPGLGAFPVPWLGMGVSPILGAWCGLGLLVGRGARALSASGPA
ncbi:hypothetical protein I3V78_09480 [Archangium primigenium]|nr:hypothetical protein [Archangium primigenium]